ncbi:MAG: MATE family efflux transporter [Candidatus Wallbacteria bacterium]|nr:MATE family efflux transporter [Candidatus Wallbacteria bacterium]
MIEYILTMPETTLRVFVKNLLVIAVPVALHNLIMSSLNFFDTLMVGQLGEIPLASVALANQVYFLNILYLVGVNSGTGIFISQHWGSKDSAGIRRFASIALLLSLAGAILFFIAAAWVPRFVLGLFSKDPAVVEVGAGYLRYVAPAYLFTAVSFCLTSLLRSTESALVPTISSSIGVAVNIALNWVLIFGRLGFPELGVVGAALATVCARGLECVILLFIVTTRKHDIAPSVRDLRLVDRLFLQKYIRVVSPVIANEVCWSVGMVVIQVIYARIGTAAAAAVGIVNSIERMSHVLSMGLAAGGAVLMGKTIGEGRRNIAEVYARYLGWVAGGTGLVVGAFLGLLSVWITSFYSVSPAVKHSVWMMLIAYAVTMPFLVASICYFMGVFRASGDTGFCFWFDVGAIWLFQIPVGMFVGFVLKLPAEFVYAAIMCLEIPKLGILLWRLKSGRWYNNLT